MKIFKYLCFGLIVLNLASVGLFSFGGGVGSLLSYVTIGVLALYYFLEKKTEPNWWLIIIALLFYSISSLQYTGETDFFIFEVIKYFIFLIGGYELTKHISTLEFNIFFFIGALSIILEAIFIPSDYGRFSGFYLNPNVAGFICITGYASTYGLKNPTLKLLGQFGFTLAGLLTFSRTFIIIWFLLNLISLKISLKNLRIFGIGFLIITTLFFIDEIAGLNNPRFEQLKGFLNNESVSAEEISSDSRTDTWAKYYNRIFESPFIGNGYKTFATKDNDGEGVHNTYLRIIGEAGIIPFFIFLAYIAYLFYWSIYFFKKAPNLIMQIIGLALFLMANHNFFTFYYVSFAAMWIQYQIYSLKHENSIEDEVVPLE
jgi:O-antigen ligase